MTSQRSRRIAVVSASPLLHVCWQDALAGSTVFDAGVGLDALVDFDTFVLDLPSFGQLRQVMRGLGAARTGRRCLWIHADIEPADIRGARQLGVTHMVHRSRGLAPVLEAISEDGDAPRVSMIGRIRDPSAVDRLSEDELLLLRRLGAGSTVTQLRATTGWSKHAVERLRVSALAKLGVQTTGEALAITMLFSLAVEEPRVDARD